MNQPNFTTKHWRISELETNGVRLPSPLLPDWRDNSRSQIIEVVILGIPLKPIWGFQKPNGEIELFNYFPLKAVVGFTDDAFRLSSNFTNNKDKLYSELGISEHRAIRKYEWTFHIASHDNSLQFWGLLNVISNLGN